ncbi:hypothetical protein C8F01DRAFT_623689 [Mycena amicta]|nr:hypothetical protein C8F01DRAFT_623689 [Mycena amicta]
MPFKLSSISFPIYTTDDEEIALIKTPIGSKFVMRWSDLICKLALDAVRLRYARVEKVPGVSKVSRVKSSAALCSTRIVIPPHHLSEPPGIQRAIVR